jgi:hypothetical protein
MEYEDQHKGADTENNEGKEREDRNPPQVDRITEFMFGPRAGRERRMENEKQDQINNGENDQEANYFTIMEQLGDIMDSIENLKPMIKQFSPIMDYIKKKI